MYFENSKPKQKRITAAVLAGLAVYIVLVAVSILTVSGRVRDMSSGAGVDATLGPLSLVHIQKTALAGGGFSLDFKLVADGLMVLFILCSFLVAVLGVYWGKKRV